MSCVPPAGKATTTRTDRDGYCLIEKSPEMEIALIYVDDIDERLGQKLELTKESGGKFGFQGISPKAFRIRIHAKGFQNYRSDPINLEQGELRFMKIALE